MSAAVQLAVRHVSAADWNAVEEQTQVRSVLSYPRTNQFSLSRPVINGRMEGDVQAGATSR